jgi:hypothetical protein
VAKTKEQEFGIDALRAAVRAFGNCNETFNQKHSAENLLKIHAAWKRAEWDIYPDQWTSYQISKALVGDVPQWDTQGRPLSGPAIEALIAKSVKSGKRVKCLDAALVRGIREISRSNDGDTNETVFYGSRDGHDWSILVLTSHDI